MAELVANCPRCGSRKITFDALSDILSHEVGWRGFHETFCVCRHCGKSTVFVLGLLNPVNAENFQRDGLLSRISGSVNAYFQVEDYICIREVASVVPPEYVPPKIEAVFKEGATCLAVQCYNAAGTMFRLCIDLATKSKLPVTPQGQQPPAGLNNDVRFKLAHRLGWLFDNHLLPGDLRDLSLCIKDDGNDGAHDGTLDKNAATDLLDFTTALLERIYTMPMRVELAKQRKVDRRDKNQAVAQARS